MSSSDAQNIILLIGLKFDTQKKQETPEILVWSAILSL
jgi:hypothetical protein